MAEELRRRDSGPKALAIAPCPELLGDSMALLEGRAYANSSQHSVAARRRLLEDLVQRVALGRKKATLAPSRRRQ